MRKATTACLSICSAIFLAVGSSVPAWAQSSRPGLGAIPYSDGGGNGVTFRTWAPNATAVGVKGQFNGWATTPMVQEAGGYWSVDVAGAQVGQEYKYRINNSFDRRDPRSRRVSNSAGNSIIYDRNAFDWGGQSFNTPWQNDLVIYEMHPGTFNAESWVPSSFDKNIERLDHLVNLGVSAVQLMPPNEFAADKSWGYNPADLFAIESSLGGPDALKRFVKACHERGIAVIIDVVHNHYGPSDLGLWQFDGWSQNGLGGIYFYNDPSKAYTWWGDTRPDFGRAEVRQFIRDQIFMFLEEYKVDGFRWDSVFNIIYYNGGSGTLPDGEAMLRDINWEMSQSFPGKIRIAEDHAFDYNMNFDSMWDVGFHDHIKWQVTQANDADRNVHWLAGKISEWPSHQRVIYSESHDTVGDLNNKKRLPRDIDSGNPSSIWARKRQLLAASVVMTAPGIPMVFQGQEMNEDWDFSAETSLRWSLTNTHAGIVRAYADMIKARRNRFGGTQGLKGTGVNVHHQDNVNKVLAMVRWDAGGGSDDVVVVMNLAATKWQSNTYEIEFPSAGTWYVHYNSDSSRYGADFDNIGPSQVTASGSPAKAPVNMGMYATLIFSKTPPPASGLVTLDPAQPDGCVPVEIAYQPSDGPLAGATNIVLAIGYNGFQYNQDVAMTNQSGTWVATYEVPLGAGEINFVFHDGNGVFDNNFGSDWNIGINNCANLPAEVTLIPPQLQGCIPVAITYEENAGPLINASNVVLYIGRNDWQDIQEIPLVEASPGVWTNQYEIMDDTWQVDFVFNDGAVSNKVWDNNNGLNWRALVAGCINPDTPGIFITNPVSSITVSNSITNITIAGYSSSNLIGQLFWSNTLTGAKNWVPASGFPWSVPGLALGEGANIFRITGISDTINPNHLAYDRAENPPYIFDDTWDNGDDGGQKFGGGWVLSGGPKAGHFLATTSGVDNLDLGPRAWGLWAYEGGLSSAVRPFKSRLNVGDVFTVKFENNWIGDGNVVGIGFQNRFGQNLFEYLFVGGDTNYLINDSLLTRATGIPWTSGQQDLSFQLTSPNTYLFKANGQSFTGTLAVSSETVVDRFRAFNFSAGGGSGFNVYIDYLSITGSPLESVSYESEVTITRAYGPNSDPDADGYATWEEELAGTNPFDGTSRLPDAVKPRGIGVMEVDIDQTVAGRWYDIFTTTNLRTGVWSHHGISQPGTGGGITLVFTNYSPELFYRTGVKTSP